MDKVKWWQRILLVFKPTKTRLIVDNSHGLDLTITAKYKEYNGIIYVYSEDYNIKRSKGSHRIRRQK